MDNKQQDKKQAKTPLANLPVLALTEKDMSSVNGGGQLNAI